MNGVFRMAIGIISMMILLSSSIAPVEAHLPGQQPYFKINGMYSTLYPVLVSSVPNFILPQDSALDSYLVDTPIEFELDIPMLPFPPDIASQSTYMWNFGDDTTGIGIKNTHTYKRIGSYILSIDIQDPTGATQLLQSVLINIIPDKGYRLPKASVKVNGQEIHDPLVDTVNIKQGAHVSLTADVLQYQEEIVEYYWDLGDREESKSKNIVHTYNLGEWMFFPVLRIKDRNGFIADTFVQINNGIQESDDRMDRTKDLLPFVLSGLFAGGIVLSLLMWNRKRKKESRKGGN